MPIKIERAQAVSAELLALFNEYYEALAIQVRDTPDKLAAMINEPLSGIWLARNDNDIVGCVALRPLPQFPGAVECKRLYVRPSMRGHGIADLLMDAVEDYARTAQAPALYLDSHDGLKAALRLYERRGYVNCPRYNDNPQATVFLHKPL